MNRSAICGLAAVAIALVTTAVFWSSLDYGFIDFDDDLYVSRNPRVLGGLTSDGIRWAFTNIERDYWIPLTWLSYMADCELWGTGPRGFRATNILFHTTNAVLLFAFLAASTRRTWASVWVAMLFAVHPLRVESVVWIAERKDVLSTAFGLLALLAYLGYVRRPGFLRYAGVFILMLLSLMAKPMLVTLPLLLLVLDYWPLQRPFGRRMWARLVVEKLPLLVLSAVFSAATIYTQSAAGAVVSLARLPVLQRVAISLSAHLFYLEKMIWPWPLALIYPAPRGPIPASRLAAALFILGGVTALAWRVAAKAEGGKRKAEWAGRPYVLAGWLWYLVVLLPVNGLVRVGTVVVADRFSYVPLIGLFIMIVWSCDAAVRGRAGRAGLAVAATVVLAACGVATGRQMKYWTDSVVLLEHTLNATGANRLACINLAHTLSERGETDRALVFYRRCLDISGASPKAHTGIGMIEFQRGNLVAAAQSFARAADCLTGTPREHVWRGWQYLAIRDHPRAAEHFRIAVSNEPDNAFLPMGLSALAWSLATAPAESLRDGEEALELAVRAAELTQRRDPAILDTLAAAYAALGQFDLAIQTAMEALNLPGPARNPGLAHELQAHLEAYRQGRSWRSALPHAVGP